jgi:DNA-binding protein YbaB
MDMNKLMQQAQQMQAAMQSAQEELLTLSIDPSVVDPEEADMLEDLILTAFQAGHRKAGELAQKEMSKVSGPMPGGLGGLL